MASHLRLYLLSFLFTLCLAAPAPLDAIIAKEKPVLLFVHGAWLNSQSWQPIRQILEPQGFTVVAPSLLSGGIRNPPVTTHRDDTAVIQREIKALINAGKEIIVIMHSYGGLVGGDAIEGFVKPKTNPPSKQGGVIAAIYLSAFLIQKGTTLLEAFDAPPPYLVPNPTNSNYLDVVDPQSIFFNDLSPKESQPWISQMRPHAAAVFASRAQYSPWTDIPTTYIVLTKDNAILAAAQRGMVQKASAQAKFPITVKEVAGSHAAWVTKKTEVANIIKQVAGF